MMSDDAQIKDKQSMSSADVGQESAAEEFVASRMDWPDAARRLIEGYTYAHLKGELHEAFSAGFKRARSLVSPTDATDWQKKYAQLTFELDLSRQSHMKRIEELTKERDALKAEVDRLKPALIGTEDRANAVRLERSDYREALEKITRTNGMMGLGSAIIIAEEALAQYEASRPVDAKFKCPKCGTPGNCDGPGQQDAGLCHCPECDHDWAWDKK